MLELIAWIKSNRALREKNRKLRRAATTISAVATLAPEITAEAVELVKRLEALEKLRAAITSRIIHSLLGNRTEIIDLGDPRGGSELPLRDAEESTAAGERISIESFEDENIAIRNFNRDLDDV